MCSIGEYVEGERLSGVDYIIKGDEEKEVIILDRATGRELPGRKWSFGVDNAIRIKHGLRAEADKPTIASMTLPEVLGLAGIKFTAASATLDAEFMERVYDKEVVQLGKIPKRKEEVKVFSSKDESGRRRCERRWRFTRARILVRCCSGWSRIKRPGNL